MKKIIAFSLLLICFSAAAENLKVVSYNIRLFPGKDGENSWEFRKDASTAMVNEVKPDVMGMQEAYREQLDFLLEGCKDYEIIGVGRDDGISKGEHMAIAYNKEKVILHNWGTYWLSETPDVPSFGWDAACRRTATWALFEMKESGQKFYMVNTHLDHKGKIARKEGLAMVFRRIQEMNTGNYPMILTGDFNVLPDNPCLSEINSIMQNARFHADYADTKGSFNGFGKYGASSGAPELGEKPKMSLRPIDYIYYRGMSDCLTFKVLSEPYANKAFISDHYPILAEFVF